MGLLPHFYINSIISWILIIVGFGIFIYPAVTIDKYFNNKKLRTTGLYSIVRHPIYSSWIFIIIPGLIFLWGSWLGYLVPIASYFICKGLIIKEDHYLYKTFGIKYDYYRTKTNAFFPKIKIFGM